jgi:2-phosphoglycerate kinase
VDELGEDENFIARVEWWRRDSAEVRRCLIVFLGEPHGIGKEQVELVEICSKLSSAEGSDVALWVDVKSRVVALVGKEG